jgi:hypothetical protein
VYVSPHGESCQRYWGYCICKSPLKFVCDPLNPNIVFAFATWCPIQEIPDRVTPNDSEDPQLRTDYASGRGINVHVTTQIVTHIDSLGIDYESHHGEYALYLLPYDSYESRSLMCAQ